MAHYLTVGESAAIAMALGEKYPNGGRLGEFPPSVEDIRDPDLRDAGLALAAALKAIERP